MVQISGANRRALPPTSYLRVFEPLRAFSDQDQAVAVSTGRVGREVLEDSTAAAAIKRLTRPLSDPFPHQHRESFRKLVTTTWDGSIHTLYCPDQLATRTILASEQLDGSMRPQLLELLVPSAAREANALRVDKDQFTEDLAHLHTRTSTWGIPFGWLILVHEDDEVEIVEDGEELLASRIYTPLHQALDRARYAAATLAIHAPEMDLLDELATLSEWLQLFDKESVIELDYGRIAALVWPDESPHDLRLGIESLAESDMTGAAASYRRLSNRWLAIRQLARAN
ncbi:hypothetical protein ACIGB6_05265 [Paeniglutamicibacter gangotriensis]|uniref:DUF8083 domain-containing protein n=2 Tax=Paeniglutamicibacter gangotriensis TaxID=254787 RepID=M7MPQ8_9MICC|nr:hypothetical protein [Paeniglutamicibacter gangotriensis]EMQ96930.1 hypothetical protein ADIAG_03781 [Paeniglutamicibacter gangotriensis Lz1y]KAA0973060.1 hypothetical protein FQ154_20045 [Paeniglutamicibacter gangotriensis]